MVLKVFHGKHLLNLPILISQRLPVYNPPPSGPALVFIHIFWTSSWSRSDRMMVAVGFNPRSEDWPDFFAAVFC